MSTVLCGVCDRPMVVVRKGRGKFLISCPVGHYRLPAPSTVPGTKWFYASLQEAEEQAERLWVLMGNSHKESRGRVR